MSIIPGLGHEAASTHETESETRVIQLPAGAEWRFETSGDVGRVLKVTLLPSTQTTGAGSSHGTAEINGTELAAGHTYDFGPFVQTSIYTHEGCSLSVTGQSESEYVAEENPMVEYCNFHFALEKQRQLADTNVNGGPRVLIIGPDNSGKSTLTHTLTAYANRQGRSPLVVNLAPREGMLCLPGSISAAVVSDSAVQDVQKRDGSGWGSGPIAGPSAQPIKMPVVYHYGFSKPEEYPDLFKPIASRLALAATARFGDEASVKRSGLIIDLSGVYGGKAGSGVIEHIVSEFSVNIIVVLGSEKLYSDMSRRFATKTQAHGAVSATDDENISVVKLSRSDGCVNRDETYMEKIRQSQIRSYFFGTSGATLSPLTISVEYAAISIFAILPEKDSNGFLPGDYDEHKGFGGQDYGDRSLKLITPSMALLGAILTVKHARSTDSPGTIRDAAVMGYLYVSDVEEAKSRLKILTPLGGKLPSQAIVWSPSEVEMGIAVKS